MIKVILNYGLINRCYLCEMCRPRASRWLQSMQFLCSEGQKSHCPLFPHGTFHQLLICPPSDASSQKGIKETGLINILLLSIILSDSWLSCQSALYLPEWLPAWYLPSCRLPRSTSTAPRLPAPPSQPSFLLLVQFLCQSSSAACLPASFFVQTLHRVCSFGQNCYHDLSSKDAALVTLCFHLFHCQIVFTRDGPCPSNVVSL